MDKALMVLESCRAYIIELQATARRDERGDGGVSYLLIILGAITIAGLVIAAVTAYVTKKNNQLQ